MKILLQLNQILSSPKIRRKILYLESKSEHFDDHKNIYFIVLKKIKAKHPKNLFFGHWNIKSIRDKFESVKEISSVKLKIILPQTSNLVYPNVKYLEKIVTHMAENYCFM